LYSDTIIQKCLNRCTSVEFIITEKCQNACKYCYRVKKHQLSNKTLLDPKDLEIYISNMFDMFGSRFFDNIEIELFGGDPLLDYHHFYEVLQVLCSKIDKCRRILIPSNTRLLQDLTCQDIKELFLSATNKDIEVCISFSVDIIDDKQRKLSKIGQMLDYDVDYNFDKVLRCLSEAGVVYGFHPMLDFDNIDKWFHQFKFYFDRKMYPYLLEVRHPLTLEQALRATEELVVIRKYVEHKISNKEVPEYVTRILNTISASRVPRGLGCSAHTSLCVNIEGNIPFCHRLMDPPWICGSVLSKRINISKFAHFKMVYDHRNHINCAVCPVRMFCSGQCVGASYEYWGDPWSPIDSICDYTRLKIYTFINYFADWSDMTKCMSNQQRQQLHQQVMSTFGENNLKILHQNIDVRLSKILQGEKSNNV